MEFEAISSSAGPRFLMAKSIIEPMMFFTQETPKNRFLEPHTILQEKCTILRAKIGVHEVVEKGMF